jgi:hypothetical protein
LVLTCIEPTTFVLAFLLHFEVLGGEAGCAVTMPDTIGKDAFRRGRSGSASASTATSTAAGTIAIVVSASSILASAAAVHDDMCFSPIAVPQRDIIFGRKYFSPCDMNDVEHITCPEVEYLLRWLARRLQFNVGVRSLRHPPDGMGTGRSIGLGRIWRAHGLLIIVRSGHVLVCHLVDALPSFPVSM